MEKNMSALISRSGNRSEHISVVNYSAMIKNCDRAKLYGSLISQTAEYQLGSKVKSYALFKY